MATEVFQIEEGSFALALVDKAATGYSDDWQTPGGAALAGITAAAYEEDGTGWYCQVTSAALTASASTTTTTIPATFCGPARDIPTPGETSFSVDVSFLQDPQIRAGLTSFLFANDTKEAYVLLGLDGDNPPKAAGRVRLTAGNFGGGARANLTSDVSFGLLRRPDILFGRAGASRLVSGITGAVTDTGSAAAARRAGAVPADEPRVATSKG
jgi:hypothetical protein